MDDFVTWGDHPAELISVLDQVRQFLAAKLGLEVKSNTCLNRVIRGGSWNNNGFRVVLAPAHPSHRTMRRLTRLSSCLPRNGRRQQKAAQAARCQ